MNISSASIRDIDWKKVTRLEKFELSEKAKFFLRHNPKKILTLENGYSIKYVERIVTSEVAGIEYGFENTLVFVMKKYVDGEFVTDVTDYKTFAGLSEELFLTMLKEIPIDDWEKILFFYEMNKVLKAKILSKEEMHSIGLTV